MATNTAKLQLGAKEQNKKKGKIAGIVLLVGLVLVLFYPLTKIIPVPGQEGIQVNLGVPDPSGGNNEPKESVAVTEPEKKEDVKEKTEPKKTKKVEKKAEPTKKVIKSKEVTKKSIKNPTKKQPKAQLVNNTKTAKQKELEAKIAKEENDKRIAKQKEAKRIEAEKKAAEKKSLSISNLFNNNNNGNGNKPTKGEEYGKAKSFGKGSGKVGGGLSNRGGAGPKLGTNFTESGNIVVEVCVDESGRVLSATYEPKGSNSNSQDLKNRAIANAKKWAFNADISSRQCGTITYTFNLK